MLPNKGLVSMRALSMPRHKGAQASRQVLPIPVPRRSTTDSPGSAPVTVMTDHSPTRKFSIERSSASYATGGSCSSGATELDHASVGAPGRADSSVESSEV